MIKFIPLTIKDCEGKDRELNLCNTLNDPITAMKCIQPGCNGIDTKIQVESKNLKFFEFEIISFCCENFKDKINKILSVH